jgi:hypothetical protein
MRMVSFLAGFPKPGRQRSNPPPMRRRARVHHGLAKVDFPSTGLKARRFAPDKRTSERLACMRAKQKPP